MTRVLIVDDRKDNLDAMEEKLTEHGFDVHCISTSQGILELVASNQPQIVLMNMNMPELDGCEASILLKNNETTRAIPVILCTTCPIDGDAERAKLAQCDAFVEKELEMEELLLLLSRLLVAETKIQVAEPKEVPTVVKEQIVS